MTQRHNPPHPGEVLKDGVFTDTDISIVGFAQKTGVTRVALSRILNGKAAISPEMALRLADALWGRAGSWLHRQANYDLTASFPAHTIKLPSHKNIRFFPIGKTSCEWKNDRRSKPRPI